MRIRAYESGDRAQCVEILLANTPEYFGPSDQEAYVGFLDAPNGRYFVVEDGDGRILGAGGIARDAEEGVAILCWGVVRPEWQHIGIGSALLRHRVESQPDARVVRVTTTQRAQGFYEAHGFHVTSVEPDGFGPGLDRVVMER